MQSKKKVMLNAGETRCIRISIHSIKDQNFVIEEASFSSNYLKLHRYLTALMSLA